MGSLAPDPVQLAEIKRRLCPQELTRVELLAFGYSVLPSGRVQGFMLPPELKEYGPGEKARAAHQVKMWMEPACG